MAGNDGLPATEVLGSDWTCRDITHHVEDRSKFGKFDGFALATEIGTPSYTSCCGRGIGHLHLLWPPSHFSHSKLFLPDRRRAAVADRRFRFVGHYFRFVFPVSELLFRAPGFFLQSERLIEHSSADFVFGRRFGDYTADFAGPGGRRVGRTSTQGNDAAIRTGATAAHVGAVLDD